MTRSRRTIAGPGSVMARPTFGPLVLPSPGLSDTDEPDPYDEEGSLQVDTEAGSSHSAPLPIAPGIRVSCPAFSAGSRHCRVIMS